jgi:uncharacterized coiled-coil protein SlyX
MCVSLEDRVAIIEGHISLQNERIEKANKLLYEKNIEANKARSDVVHCKDGLKLAAESTATTAGVGSIIFGSILCAIPGCAAIGVPMITVGVASTAIGSTTMAATGGQMSNRNKIYEDLHKRGVNVSFAEANDLADGKTVDFIGSDMSIQKISIVQKQILLDTPKLL